MRRIAVVAGILLMSLLGIAQEDLYIQGLDSMDEFYRLTDWKFYPDSVVKTSDSTYTLKAVPYDYNDPGVIDGRIGNYIEDFVGHVFEVTTSTSDYVLTVYDKHKTGKGPASGMPAKCYESVYFGDGVEVGAVNRFTLDESAREAARGRDNEILWRKIISYKDSVVFNKLAPDSLVWQEGKVFYDVVKHALSYYNDEAEVIVNTGQEVLFRVYNGTSELIENGTIVAPLSSTVITKADRRYKEKSQTLAVATHDIEVGTWGWVTKVGQVGGLNTSAYIAGQILYLGEEGQFTDTRGTDGTFTAIVAVVDSVSATDGIVTVDITTSELTVEVTMNNGFPGDQRTGTDISFDDGALTFTISPNSTMYHYYDDGEKFEKDHSNSVVITDVTGLHVFYFSDTTLLTIANPTSGQIDNVIRNECSVAYVYWNATTGTSYYLGDERHNLGDPLWHAWAHFNFGSQIPISTIEDGGYLLTNIVADGNGSVDASAQFGVAFGLLNDEDIVHLSPTIASTTGTPIFYKTGATGEWIRVFKPGFSIYNGASGAPYFNEYVGGAWQLTRIAPNNFMTMHQFATNDITYKVITIMGEYEYNSLGDAQQGINDEVNAIVKTGFPAEEFKWIGSEIFEYKTSYANQVMARIRSLDDGSDYLDGRTSAIGGSGSISPSTNRFIDHEDTPSTYLGQAGKLVEVNTTEDALIFNAKSDIPLTDFDSTGVNWDQSQVVGLVDSIAEYRADINQNASDIATKQNNISLTTNDFSGAATFASDILNVPNYVDGLTSGYLPYFTTKLVNSPVYTDGTNTGIGTTNPVQSPSDVFVADRVLRIGDNSGNPELRLAGVNSDSTSSRIVFDNSSAGQGMSLIFSSDATSSFGNDGLIIADENGFEPIVKINRDNQFIGIGTMSPSANLDIVGTTKVSATPTGSTNVVRKIDLENQSFNVSGLNNDAGYLTTVPVPSLQEVTDVGNTTTNNLYINKASAMLRLQGSYPLVDFNTGNNQGISILHNEFDGELPVGGYGLVVTGSPLNAQFPTAGTLSFNVLGEIFAGDTALSLLHKVYHAGNSNLPTVDWSAKELTVAAGATVADAPITDTDVLRKIDVENGSLDLDVNSILVNGSPISGTTDHAALSNLGYYTSGHTGFAGTGVSNSFTARQTIDKNGLLLTDATAPSTSTRLIEYNSTVTGDSYYWGWSGGSTDLVLWAKNQTTGIYDGRLSISESSVYADYLETRDDAYSSGWNGSNEVPTKNALYDKIETIGGTTDHSALNNLAYSSSGHTGFAGTGAANTFTANQTISATNGSFTIKNLGSSSGGLGFILQDENGSTKTGFGYNNSSNEAFIWGYSGTPIKFAAGGSESFRLNTDGSIEMPRIANATKTNVLYYDGSTKEVSYGTAPSGGGVNIGPFAGQIPFTNATTDDFDYDLGLDFTGNVFSAPNMTATGTVSGDIGKYSNYIQLLSVASPTATVNGYGVLQSGNDHELYFNTITEGIKNVTTPLTVTTSTTNSISASGHTHAFTGSFASGGPGAVQLADGTGGFTNETDLNFSAGVLEAGTTVETGYVLLNTEYSSVSPSSSNSAIYSQTDNRLNYKNGGIISPIDLTHTRYNSFTASASSYTKTYSQGPHFAFTVSASTTINIQNIPDGASGNIYVTQNSGGGNTVTFVMLSTSIVTLSKVTVGPNSGVSTTANEVTKVEYQRIGSTCYMHYIH